MCAQPEPSHSVRSFYARAEGSAQGPKAVPEIRGRGPSSFAEYAKGGHFSVLRHLLAGRAAPAKLLEQILAGGLRGCGGSHIPLARKWQAALAHGPRYLVVNGMEGEPYTFKDYFLMREHPHIVLEGLALSCRVLGIAEAYLVINGAYRECRAALAAVLEEQAPLFAGLSIHLVDGPELDLYVLGEESALLNYLEGKRGEPRLKPPFPHECGLWGRPTLINNVETLSWIPLLLSNPQGFAAGLPKLLTLLGDVARPGIYEAVLGEPLSAILQRAEPEALAFVEVGGISGGLLPAALLDVAYSDEALAPLGVQVGSGTLRLFKAGRDPRQAMSEAIAFFRDESCGRCTPCRVGTQELAKFTEALQGRGVNAEQRQWLQQVAHTLEQTSTCGLGRGAPLPLLTYLRHFAPSDHD